ncbi:MAG: T9SS type A sorting domain-containing protein [Chitinophagaceae bacterium]
MKQVILLLLLCFSLNTQAQNMYPYAFSKSMGTYNNLSGSTSLTNQTLWWDTMMTVPIGFPFKWALGNRTLTSIDINSYGQLFSPMDLSFDEEYYVRLMFPYYANLSDKGYNTDSIPKSNISYLLTGTSPNRILKIEYRNCGFFLNSNGQDSTNFQIWLYEGSNIIEYHYGPQSVLDFEFSFYFKNGPLIGLIYQTAYNNNLNCLDFNLCSYVAGDQNTANAIYSTTPFPLVNPPSNLYFDSIPANGQIFRWAPSANPNSINEIETFNNLKVYPTPFNESITIENENNLQALRLSDLNGSVLIEQKVEGKKATLNTNTLASGVYFLSITDAKNNRKTMKVVK